MVIDFTYGIKARVTQCSNGFDTGAVQLDEHSSKALVLCENANGLVDLAKGPGSMKLCPQWIRWDSECHLSPYQGPYHLQPNGRSDQFTSDMNLRTLSCHMAMWYEATSEVSQA